MTGTFGKICTKAQNRISNPIYLKRVVTMIGAENWVSMSADVKGDIYEGLLEKNAADINNSAGQYFTPRVFIKAMVECMRPQPEKTIVDPAAGTGGFILASYDYLFDTSRYSLDCDQREFLKNKTFRGWELVPNTYRLCFMNLFLYSWSNLLFGTHRYDS